MSTKQIISKVWSFCNTLRDDGVGYGGDLGFQFFLTGNGRGCAFPVRNGAPSVRHASGIVGSTNLVSFSSDSCQPK